MAEFEIARCKISIRLIQWLQILIQGHQKVSAQSKPMPLSHAVTVIASLAETIYNIITQE